MEGYTILFIGAALCLGCITTPVRSQDANAAEEANLIIAADLLTESLCQGHSREFLQYVLMNQHCSRDPRASWLARAYLENLEIAELNSILARMQYYAVLITYLSGGVAGSDGIQNIDWNRFMTQLQANRFSNEFFQRNSRQIIAQAIERMREVDNSIYFRTSIDYLNISVTHRGCHSNKPIDSDASSTDHSPESTKENSSESSENTSGSPSKHNSGSSEEHNSSSSKEHNSNSSKKHNSNSSKKHNSSSSKEHNSNSSKKHNSSSSKEHNSSSSKEHSSSASK